MGVGGEKEERKGERRIRREGSNFLPKLDLSKMKNMSKKGKLKKANKTKCKEMRNEKNEKNPSPKKTKTKNKKMLKRMKMKNIYEKTGPKEGGPGDGWAKLGVFGLLLRSSR